MNIILLSGGSGKRLWPLSNDVRSKQFIKLFKDGENYESMVQRVYRQITTVDPNAKITIATSKSQASAIKNQLGEKASICVEPCRRDTFPAIALAATYLHDELGVETDEAVVVCPVDPYVDNTYYEGVKTLQELAEQGGANLTLMGIEPTVPSEKYGYIIPESGESVSKVKEFKEKPDKETAKKYLAQKALWNAGIFAFKLRYVMDQFDRIMIQKLVGLTAAGIYSVAYNAGMLLKIVTQSANNALIPWEYERLEKKQMKEFDNVLFVVFIAVACIAMFFICFAPEMMRILAGEKYYEAVYAIPPVVIGLFFLFMYTTFANVEFFYEQNRFTMYISMIGAVANIIMNYFGIKMFGYIAAAYTTLICYIIFAFSHYVYMTYSVKKALQIDKVFKTNRLLILSAVVIFGGIAVAYLYKYTILRYCVCGIIVAVAYIKRNVFLDMLEVLKRKKT